MVLPTVMLDHPTSRNEFKTVSQNPTFQVKLTSLTIMTPEEMLFHYSQVQTKVSCLHEVSTDTMVGFVTNPQCEEKPGIRDFPTTIQEKGVGSMK